MNRKGRLCRNTASFHRNKYLLIGVGSQIVPMKRRRMDPGIFCAKILHRFYPKKLGNTRGMNVFSIPSFDHVAYIGICVTIDGIIIVIKMIGNRYFPPFHGIFVIE